MDQQIAGCLSTSLNPFSSPQPSILGKSIKPEHLSRGLKLLHGQPHAGFSGAIVGGLVSSSVCTFNSGVMSAALPIVASVASPPRVRNSRSGVTVPELCLALPKSKRRRGGNGGADDGNDGNGGDYFRRWEGEEEDGEGNTQWAVVWALLCMSSAYQTLSFLLFDKEDNPARPLLAATTFTLCAR